MAIRVLHLITSLQRGGIEKWLLSMLKHVPRTQCEMDFCCKGATVGDLAQVAENFGAKVYHCKLRVSQIGFLRGLRRILIDGKYDIVQSHIHSYSGLPVMVCQRLGIPVITSFHAIKFQPRTWTIFPLLREMRAVYSKMSVAYSLNRSRLVTGCSQAVLDSHLDGRPTNCAKSRVLYYGVAIPEMPSDRQRVDFRVNLGWRADCPIVIHVGRFTEEKNHLGVLDVFEGVVNKISSAKLVLIGDGPLRPMIEKMVADRGLLKNVRLLGLRDDAQYLMSISEVLVLPSIHEGFAIVGLEASAAGIPVVGSKVGGIMEAVVDGHTGKLHEMNDVGGMVESVCRFLDDHSYRRKVGQAGRERVQKQFSLQSSVENLLRLHHDCLSEN